MPFCTFLLLHNERKQTIMSMVLFFLTNSPGKGFRYSLFLLINPILSQVNLFYFETKTNLPNFEPQWEFDVNHGLAGMEWISQKKFSDPFVSLQDLHLVLQVYIVNVGENH